jgi:DnaJ-class molecular chaperone
MTFAELQAALTILGIEDRMTFRQIKERFRGLARNHHPDLGATSQEQMEQINRAYAIVNNYCENYRLSFSEKEFYSQDTEAHLQRQFSEDPIWGR